MSVGVGIFVIAAIVYVGVSYGQMIIENNRLRKALGEDEPYCPVRYMFFCSNEDAHMQQLVNMCTQAHSRVNIGVNKVTHDTGIIHTIFDNGDEVVVYNYENAQIVALTQYEIKNSTQKIFVDSMLPASASRAIVEKLGLINYTVTVGICSPEGENNG